MMSSIATEAEFAGHIPIGRENEDLRFMTAAPVRHCLGLRRQRIKQKATEPAAKTIPSISIPTTSRPHLCRPRASDR
jgi:hypothetical protein